MICKNRGCKHNSTDNRCKNVRKLKIDATGHCTSFEKGFMYYIDLVYDALDKSNFIPTPALTPDMKIGLYYVMKIFDLGFAEIDAGPVLGRAVMLKEKDTGNGLTTDKIISRPLNQEAFSEVVKQFNDGVLPGPQNEQSKKTKKEFQPFGWLSPTGEFTEGDFAEHESVALNIIDAKGFHEEYREWQSISFKLARDFLSAVKGYVLIHNPFGTGGYIISHEKPLTKKQKDFLYGYFADMGDSFMADKYV